MKRLATAITQRLGLKARPLRLIRREWGRKIILGPLGQRMHCFCLGRWSITVWRIHKFEVDDPRFCTPNEGKIR